MGGAGARARLARWTPPTRPSRSSTASARSWPSSSPSSRRRLRRARRAAAGRFSQAVTAELAGLAMPHARVAGRGRAAVGRARRADARRRRGRGRASGSTAPTRSSCGCVPHPGAAAQPLQQGASGGELSRVMLAIEVVLRRGRRAADVGVRRGRCRRRRAGRGRDRATARPAGPPPPGARRHPPAAGGRVRRPSPRGRQGHRRCCHLWCLSGFREISEYICLFLNISHAR